MKPMTVRKAMKELRKLGYYKLRHDRENKIIQYYKEYCEGNYWANTQVITDGQKTAYMD